MSRDQRAIETQGCETVGTWFIGETRASSEITSSLLRTMNLLSQNEEKLMNSGSVIDQDNSSIHVGKYSLYVLENKFGVGRVFQYDEPVDEGDSANEGTFISGRLA